MHPGMYGADVAELRVLAARLDRAVADLTSTMWQATSSITRTRAWTGPEADGFRSDWQHLSLPRIRDTITALEKAAAAARRNADQQQFTSAADTSTLQIYAPYVLPTSIHVSGSASTIDDPAHGANSPFEVISDLQDAANIKSGVQIRKIVQPEGTVSYIVYIPGTQAALPGSNPFDVTSDIEAGTGHATDVTHLVEEAMRQAGIGRYDPVMLAGHSLGGLTAGNLAADPSFRANYDVKAVLTVGVSVASDRIPSSIAVTQVNNLSGDPISVITGAGIAAVVPGTVHAQNLTQIQAPQVDLQYSRLIPMAADLLRGAATGAIGAAVGGAPGAILGEVVGGDPANFLSGVLEDHGNLSEYAGAVKKWQQEGGHLAVWQSSTAAFQAPAGASSSITSYKGVRTS